MIHIYFSSFLTSIYFISAGIFFSKFILKIEYQNIENKNILSHGLFGFIFLGFVSLILNFFIPLDNLVNTIIITIFIIYLLKTNTLETIIKITKYSLILSLLCTLLLTHSTTYRPDAGLYHLPYTGILNSEKIIIGLSNLHFRFGHTSIMQFISALNNNYLFGNEGILIPTALLFSFFFTYLINEIFNKKKSIIKIFILFLIIFLCLRFNRYSDYGNDTPAHIFYFFLTYLTFKNFYKSKNFDHIYFNKTISLAIFIIFNKITLFLAAIIPLWIILYKKKIFELINLRHLIFLTIFIFSFFLKNFLVSGCLAFPIEITCSKNIKWYDKNSQRSSNAKITMAENEAWTKAWPEQKGKQKKFNEYIGDFGWIKTWVNSHGKRIIEKIFPFVLSILVILIFITFNKKKIKHNYNNRINYLFYFLISINLAGTIMWFIKFPVFRYGLSYLICLFLLIILFFFKESIENIEKKKLNKIIRFSIVIFFSVFLIKNSHKIFKNYNNVYIKSPWPKIYSETKNNSFNTSKAYIKENEILFYKPELYPLCYYSKRICTHDIDVQYKINEINLKIFKNYKIFYFE